MQATDSTLLMLMAQQILAIVHITHKKQAGASDTAACCAMFQSVQCCVQATTMRQNVIIHVHFRCHIEAVTAATAGLKWTASSYLDRMPDLALATHV